MLFTGSPAVGRVGRRACVSREKEVTVELGGKDAMLVLADAHLPRAVAGALWAGCAGAGQARGSVERVYVAREVYERFVAGLVRGAGRCASATPPTRACRSARSPRAPAPSTSSELVRRGGRAGRAAALRRAGQPAAGCDAGAFYAPAVLTGVTHEMRLMREPIDGPVLAVMAVDSRRARRSRWPTTATTALGASVWTADRYRGAADRARAARGHGVAATTTCPGRRVSRGPWGAAAGGGLGRTLGEAGLRACAQEKLITWDPPALRGLWWGPYDEHDASARRARGGASCAPAREADRERAWRDGRARARADAARGRSGAACREDVERCTTL